MSDKPEMDDLRKAAGQKLLDAAYEFWQACRKEGQYGAVQWLTDYNGRMLIFTRGEYRETLMRNIESMNPEHFFQAEHIPGDNEESET